MIGLKVIFYDQIDKNIKKLKEKNELCLVLKNDAYGFGMKEVVSLAEKNNIKQFAVNTLEEAIRFRGYCEEKVILFGNCEEIVYLKQYRIIPTAQNEQQIRLFRENKIFYAVEIDIGMHRFGLDSLNQMDWEDPFLDTIYFHFYKQTSDNSILMKSLAELCENKRKKYHFGGSMVIGQTTSPIRIGKALYSDSFGYYGKVIHIKVVSPNQTIGYEGEYTTTTTERIAILDVGYYNGIRPHFKGYVYFHNKTYPVVGRVCMNHCFVRIDDTVQIGDVMEFFGKNLDISEFLKYNSMSEYESFLSLR